MWNQSGLILFTLPPSKSKWTDSSSQSDLCWQNISKQQQLRLKSKCNRTWKASQTTHFEVFPSAFLRTFQYSFLSFSFLVISPPIILIAGRWNSSCIHLASWKTTPELSCVQDTRSAPTNIFSRIHRYIKFTFFGILIHIECWREICHLCLIIHDLYFFFASQTLRFISKLH